VILPLWRLAACVCRPRKHAHPDPLPQNLGLKGVLLKRYKRFRADVEAGRRAGGGDLPTAHTGPMTGVLKGPEAWCGLRPTRGRERKLRRATWGGMAQVVAPMVSRTGCGVNTALPNDWCGHDSRQGCLEPWLWPDRVDQGRGPHGANRRSRIDLAC